tara:strand:- start:1085 stop:1693 length:609 start_codon:yes stop_codon:yes gene_type:complete
MSKISLKHSGGNVVSLNVPTSAPTSADVAFKLPNADGTSGQVLTTDGSGNLGWATDQGGKILKVHHVSSTTAQSSQSSSYIDVTNITITLTPAATSKCFVHVALNGYTEGTSTYNVTNSYSLQRDGTEIAKQIQNIRLDNSMSINYLQNGGSIVMAILDTHGKDGSTAVTYKVQGKTSDGYFHINSSYNTQSSITVYEVAPN